MKNTVILLALLTSGLISAQEEAKLVLEKQGKKIRATYYYDNGQIRQEGFFVNGKLDGQWIAYDESGIKTCRGEYTKGVKTGTWFFWNNGNGQKTLAQVDFANNKIEKMKSYQQEAIVDLD